MRRVLATIGVCLVVIIINAVLAVVICAHITRGAIEEYDRALAETLRGLPSRMAAALTGRN